MSALLLRHDVQEHADWLDSHGWSTRLSGLAIPPRRKRRYDRPVAFETFAGAGGFGCGFHQAGWHVAGATEWWHVAASTYLLNLARPGVKVYVDDEHRAKGFTEDPGVVGTGWIANQSGPGCEHFWLYDIKNLTGAMVLDALGLDEGEIGCVTGGPPCQGFSTAGKQNVMDPRNSLVFEYARLILELVPMTFVMENVPGMLRMKTPEGIPVIDAFCSVLAEGGYGEYQALRKSMEMMPDARAGVRKAGTFGPKKKKSEPEPAGDDDELALFDLGGES